MDDLDSRDGRIGAEFEPLDEMGIAPETPPVPGPLGLPHLGFDSREDERHAISAFMSLSEREATVLAHLAHGLSAKEVAIRLNVSSRTVDTFRTRALLKLHARNTADAVRILATLAAGGARG